MTSRPTPPAGGGPGRRVSSALSCVGICVDGNGTRKSSFASSSTPRPVMPLPHESHHLPAVVIVSRLREILRIREAAYRSRNPELLRSVYSSDCPCLASDEKAIYELLRRAYMWDGIETSVEIRRVTKIHERLWTVTALFRSETLRIETEDGKLIRKEPAGSDLFKFTLVKPRYAHSWLLGRASVVEG
jgi:hypothetical protein